MIPKPTVQSGWEEMKVEPRSKTDVLNVYLGMPLTSQENLLRFFRLLWQYFSSNVR